RYFMGNVTSIARAGYSVGRTRSRLEDLVANGPHPPSGKNGAKYIIRDDGQRLDLRYLKEILELMMVPKCIVSPQANLPVMGIVQDTLLGCRKITKRDTFIEKINLIRTAAWHSETETGYLTPGDTQVRIAEGEEVGPDAASKFFRHTHTVASYHWILQQGFSIGIGDTITDASTMLIIARSFRYNRVEHAQHHPINSAKRLEHITCTIKTAPSTSPWISNETSDNIPLWVKLVNLPFEAWNTKVTSSNASCLGKPLIMDKMTTRMCNEGVGRLRFATVLIVVNADKELKDIIEICYKDKNNVTKGSKFVNVEYAWKPPMCAKYALRVKKW
nr:hypothetical protein [Tanacetum cinerariifolium]